MKRIFMKKLRKIRFFISILLIIIGLIFLVKLYESSTKLQHSKSYNANENDSLKDNRHHLMTLSDHSQLIDWNDYEFIKYEETRSGFGEKGKAEFVDKEEKEAEDKLYKQNGFNGYISDKISLNRSIPDIRHPGCRHKKYLKDLPDVSVVVPFYNEHWSTLLRTAYSVINRSPANLLKEIILVDDGSKKQFLKEKLDNFVAENLPKVKVIHLKRRAGLINARLAGAKIATGKVLIFLDSHTEANINWLPPLLDPIARNYKVCMCPFIDVIDWKTFAYTAQDEGARGAFDWKFFYKRLPLRKQDIANMPEPFPSPVMAGGLFAISAKFFWELGGYDPGLDIWGGEQYELSFKVWQCGGEMYDAPCSRVGHVYRGGRIEDNSNSDDEDDSRKGVDVVTRNYKRVAEVWMDEYKEFLYMRDPNKFNNTDAGDLSEQIAVREKLQCKPFKWFIENIAPDLVEKYPTLDPPDFAYGTIKSLANPRMCVDTLGHSDNEQIGLYACADDKLHPQSNQNYALTWLRDIRIKFTDTCWDAPGGGKAPVLLMSCHSGQGNQLWRYYPDRKEIVHVITKRCLTANLNTNFVFIGPCDNTQSQKWEFAYYNQTALDNWLTAGVKLL